MPREHEALIQWSKARVDAGLPSGLEWVQPAWVLGSGEDAEGWSLVCHFSRPPDEEGNPSSAFVRFVMSNAPHGSLREGAKLHMLDGAGGSLAEVSIGAGSRECFTALERSVLDRLIADAGLPSFHRLPRSVRRELTGVGSFTHFDVEQLELDLPMTLSLSSVIEVARVEAGLGAVLFLNDGGPHCLELFTYGDEAWDGTADDFVVG